MGIKVQGGRPNGSGLGFGYLFAGEGVLREETVCVLAFILSLNFY